MNSNQNVPNPTPAPVQEHAPAPEVIPPAPPAKNNTLGLVAMIMAIVGLIFALIPGAVIVGWILLPVSFILGIVSLFLAGKKAFGIAAIIISVVGGIIAPIFFLAQVGNIVEESLGGSEVTIVEEQEESGVVQSDDGAEVEGVVSENVDDAAVGTRENPIPIGVAFANDNWQIVVDSINMDANDEVLAANQFNDEPQEGYRYVMATITATYIGEDKGSTFEISEAFVSDSGEVYNTYDNNAVAPEPTFGSEELYTDGSYTGNVVFEIPVDASGSLRIQPGILADDVFVATP